MEIVYFTIAAIFLYLVSDWLLQRIEVSYGERLKYRSVIFFVIIMVLAVGLFTLVQSFQPEMLGAPLTGE